MRLSRTSTHVHGLQGEGILLVYFNVVNIAGTHQSCRPKIYGRQEGAQILPVAVIKFSSKQFQNPRAGGIPVGVDDQTGTVRGSLNPSCRLYFASAENGAAQTRHNGLG